MICIRILKNLHKIKLDKLPTTQQKSGKFHENLCGCHLVLYLFIQKLQNFYHMNSSQINSKFEKVLQKSTSHLDIQTLNKYFQMKINLHKCVIRPHSIPKRINSKTTQKPLIRFCANKIHYILTLLIIGSSIRWLHVFESIIMTIASPTSVQWIWVQSWQ